MMTAKNKKNIQKKFELLKYTPEIDFQIINAVSDILNVKIKKIVKVEHGNINYVYKIETNEKSLIARVFTDPTWPIIENLQFVEKYLSKIEVDHSKIFYISHDSQYNKFLPYGFMISEFIEGKDCLDAIKDGDISIEDFYFRLGELLKQIHKTKFPKYGNINNGNGIFENYFDFILNSLKKTKERLKNIKDFDVDIPQKIKEFILKDLKPIENKFHPVFVHGSIDPSNCILTNNGKIILIDWDGVKFDLGIEDILKIIHEERYSAFGDRKNVAKRLKASLLKGYGKIDFNDNEMSILEKSYFVKKYFRSMIFYYFSRKNLIDYNETQKKLINLLEKIQYYER